MRRSRACGHGPDRIARLLARFRRQQADGVFPGGQIAVRRLAVDEAVGIARGWRSEEGIARVEFTPALRSCVFSAGKPIVTRFRPSDATVVPVASTPDFIVGAGVSTCAPQAPVAVNSNP
jgi:hypothetical protein